MTTRARVLLGLAVAVLAVAVLVTVAGDDDGGARAGRDALDTVDTSTSTTGSRSTTTSAATSTTAAAPTATVAAPGTTPAAGPPPTAAPPPSSPPPPTTARPGSLATARIRTTRVASVGYPIAMAVRPGDGSLWIATKAGGVCRLEGASCTGLRTVASVSGGGEQGLLGITFNGAGDRFYISYTNTAGDSRVDELAVNGDGSPDPGRRRQLLAVDQPEANHNGGNLVWGPDGRLWLGLGDGGGGGDRHGTGDGNGQDPTTDLGKILRIDPGASPPVVERWIRGVRNPWRFSFDRATGDLWVGDVGQGSWEEITVLPADAQQGRNLGWRCFEGTHRFSDCEPAGGHTGPIFEYSHAEGCSITGGYVYRGSRIPDLVGAYLFADYCEGELRALTQAGGRVSLHRRLGVDPGRVVSFGQDGAGELYVLTPTEVLRIDPV